MNARRISALALAVVLLATQGPIPAGAQTRSMSYADSLAFQNVARSAGSWARLRVLEETGSFEARGSDVAPQGIRRRESPDGEGVAGPDLVSWSEIQRVQVRGNEAGKGAVIGGTAFALIGGAVAVALSNVDIGFGRSRDPSAGQIAAWVGGCTLAGVVVGGTIGVLIPRWKTVHTWAGF